MQDKDQRQTAHNQRLSELDEWQIHDSDQDICGRQLKSTAGTDIGMIQDMLVDTERERVTAVLLEDGSTYPVESLEIRDEGVFTHELDAAGRGPTVTIYEARLIRPVR